MSDPVRLPDGSRLTGVLAFHCCDCDALVEINLSCADWIEMQSIVDEEICGRCDSCRPDYLERMNGYRQADDEHSEY